MTLPTPLLTNTELLEVYTKTKTPTAIHVGEDATIQAANDAMLAVWGKDRSIIGKSLVDALPELKGQPFIAMFKKVWLEGLVISGTDTAADLVVNGQQRTFYFDFEYRAIKRADGKTLCILHTAVDVTERFLNREVLAQAAEKAASLLREQALNEELAASNEELTAINEELAQSQQRINQLNNELESRIARRTRDLANSENRLRSMIMASHYPLVILAGEDFRVEIANQPLADLWGRTLADINGRPLLDILPELADQPFPAFLENVYSTGEPYGQLEEVFYRETAGGRETYYVSFHYDPLKDENGKVNAIVVAATDITEMVRTRQMLEKSNHEQQVLNEEITATNEELASANEELGATNEELSATQQALEHTLAGLSESDQRFRNLVHTATVGIILLMGKEMKVGIVNDGYGKLIDRTVDELVGRNLFDIIPETEARFRPIIDSVRETGEPLYFYSHPYIIYKGGAMSEGFLDLVYQPYREASGIISGVIILCQDVTQQVNDRKQLLESERRFKFMLNAIPQQVWTATPDGNLNYVNQVVCDNFGYEMDAIVGKGWQAFVHPDDFAGCITAWQNSLLTGQEYLTEFRLLMNNRGYRWFLARAVPYREDDRITLWLGTNTDIELQKNNEQRKDEFLSIASHELRTPLTSIKAFNQIMQRTKDTEKLPGFVNKSAAQIYRLEKLISDLLDVSRINAGKMVYNMEPFSFADMINASVEASQYAAQEYEIVIESNTDITYTGDRIRLEQVMQNFLGNAIKYSPGNKRILVNSKAADNNIVVSVQDFGIGIAPDHLDRLFERYYRVDNTAMRFEGLGLGLFISSEVLKRHKGTFWIESSQGEGSTFYFQLPMVTEPAAQQVIKTDVFYKDSHLTLLYDEHNQWIIADWKGFISFQIAQSGCMLMLEMLKKNNCSRVINDNVQVLGTWSEVSDWAGETWFPMMEQAGLKFFAWVLSPGSFSQMSAKKTVDVMQGNVVTQFFTDGDSARNWLGER